MIIQPIWNILDKKIYFINLLQNKQIIIVKLDCF